MIQDTTVAVTTSSIGILTGALALWAILGPAIASWFTGLFNKVGGMLDGKPDFVKTIFYFFVNWVLQLAGSFAHFEVKSGMAAVNFSQVFWTGLIGALGGTIIYKIGHRTPPTV